MRITFESLLCAARLTGRRLVLPPPSFIDHVSDAPFYELYVYDPAGMAAVVPAQLGGQDPPPNFHGSLDEYIAADRTGALPANVALCPRASRIQHFECLRLSAADSRFAAEIVLELRLAQRYHEAAAEALALAGLSAGGYHAVHLRRGDFAQFRPETQWSGADLQGRVRSVFPAEEARLPLLVACAVPQGQLDPFPELAVSLLERRVLRTDELRGRQLGMLHAALVDTLLLVNAKRFAGTPDSTYSSGVWHWRARERAARRERPEAPAALGALRQPSDGTCWQRCTDFNALAWD